MSGPRFCSALSAAVLSFVITGLCLVGFAQDTAAEKSASSDGVQAETTKERPTAKELKRRRDAFNKEVNSTYKKWLNEDVRYIITDEERQTFVMLGNDEERDNFIENFWNRRNPNPDSLENDYKEEHYKRIAYANEHFAAGIPGWRTDRGRIYVMYGAADEIEAHPSGGSYMRPPEEGGGNTSTYPFETWRYRYLEGIGQNIIIEFVDPCMCGEYHMTMDRSEKDALKNVPNAGLTQYEQMGLASKSGRFSQGGLEQLGAGPFNKSASSDQFSRLEQYAKLQRPPAIKFKDLEKEMVTHRIRTNMMPFDVNVAFLKVTSSTVLVPVTLRFNNKDMTWVTKDGVAKGVINILGRVTSLTGRVPSGGTFEDTIARTEPAGLLPQVTQGSSLYWKALPLPPGRYKLDIVAKDVNGDRVGVWTRSILVPQFTDDKLTSSTLILADQMESVPAKNVGQGSFVIGSTKVRPRLETADGKPASFKKNERLNLWMQVYNLGIDQNTHKPSAQIEYDVMNAVTNKSVVHTVESTDQLGNVGDQLTLQKSLALNALEPGIYRITVKVNDNISKQPLLQSARFAVE